MICLVLCVRDAVPAHRFGGALGLVMLVAWAGMGAGGYVGGAMFDMYASYALSFALAGAAGLLNLLVIGAMMLADRSDARAPRGIPVALSTWTTPPNRLSGPAPLSLEPRAPRQVPLSRVEPLR
jgi:MFS family permease